MIKFIDISKFGSFRDFSWKTALRNKHGNVTQFGRMNIFYGRNYSGKTTLSRVIRSLETGEVPKRFEQPDFKIATDTESITARELRDHNLEVRVYNRDFITEHLSFLTDESGEIEAFAILGKENKETQKKIKDLETRIGTTEPPTGIQKSLAEASANLRAAESDASDARSEIEKKLTKKANSKPDGIKYNTLYRDPTYNITKLRKDIEEVRESRPARLSDEEVTSLGRELNESHLPNITLNTGFSPILSRLRTDVSEIVSRERHPKVAIADLLNAPPLQTWVRSGIALHKEKRKTCAFCESPLTPNNWKRLADHFDEASTKMEAEIDKKLQDIEAEEIRISKLATFETIDLYESLRSNGENFREALNESVLAYKTSLKSLKTALSRRRGDLFTPMQLDSEPTGIEDSLIQALESTASIANEHNNRSESLSADQLIARDSLRLDEVAKFIDQVDIESMEERVKTLEEKASGARMKYEVLENELSKLLREVEELHRSLKDESRGAERVNNYLTHHFGHKSLRLENIEDSQGSRFQIFRCDTPAFNLSEGECSLVAFCYFIARLEAASIGRSRLIIFIDDPISSLDDNHIFFIFSLIETVITRRARDANGIDIKTDDGKPVFTYHQLFISTHNLEFLKYCKRLTNPTKERRDFLITAGVSGSRIEVLPDHLKNYATEFNFLFSEICACAGSNDKEAEEHSLYSFGNNLRKFLESYLFFKYPFTPGSNDAHDQRIRKFFGGEEASEPLVQRLTNEYSHLEYRFDRGAQPVDKSEISRVALFVLSSIRSADPEQYQCLLNSIGQDDPLDREA